MTAKRKDITPSILRLLYFDKNLSTRQIGKILGCHPSTVNKKLHEYQIIIKKPFRKIDIGKKELVNLYTKEKLSTYKIANLLECNVRTITNKMKLYHIQARSVKKDPTSKNRLVDLYQNKRLSLKKIGLMYKMTPSGILKRVRKFNIPLRKSWETNTGIKIQFEGTPVEKAYMIGFRLGDLGVRQSSKRTKMIKVGSNTTKGEQISLIKNLFKKYSKVWVSKPNPIGVTSVSTILHPSFSFLLPKNDNIEKWIKSNTTTMQAFIAGYIDAEGSFGVYDKRAKFRLGSYDKNILKQISIWFGNCGMKSILKLERKKKPGQNKDFWRITINEANSLLLLYGAIYKYIRHKKRISDFKKIIENINLRLKNGTIHL
ncbi:MAG: LAGLIDADG family homing endonuclease [Patescibacteria group bacterium]